MNKEELDKHRRLLIEKVKELKQENKQLKERIDKAIEYINETGLYCDYGDLCNQSAKDLLEILGDKENE